MPFFYLLLLICLSLKGIEAEAFGLLSDQKRIEITESPPHLQIALAFEGIKEQGNNGGPEVEKVLNSVGLKKGNPYCAAFVSYCLLKANAIYPRIRSGMAKAFITRKSIKAVDVMRGVREVPPGSIAIWSKGATPQGHAGFVVKWGRLKGKTIEGNTSPGAGSQRDGDGFYVRTRKIEPYNYFRITHFTLVEYA